MESVLRASEIKPDFEGLKIKWKEMLDKYYLSDGILNPLYTKEVFCPHCGKEHIAETFNLNGFLHNTCAECQTLYVSPRLTDECIEELYSDEYYSEFFTRSMLPVFEKRKQLIGVKKYDQLNSLRSGTEPGKILDIGAGIGEVIDVFKENGWNTYVVEMNEVAVDWLRQRGHDDVFHGALDQYTTSNKFDLIMAWNVIEHVVNPDSFLKRVHDMLAPGGIFVSEVPHGQSLLVDMTKKTGLDPKRILMGEQHIVLYSTDAYLALHERNGLEKIYIQTNGLDFDTIFKESHTLVSDDILSSLQQCIDSKLYGDLLRGFWRLK
jgi:SAM-dependent methyltransferase